MIIKVRSVNKISKQAPLLPLKIKFFLVQLAYVCTKKTKPYNWLRNYFLIRYIKRMSLFYTRMRQCPATGIPIKEGLYFHQRKHPNLDIGHLQRAYQASLCSPMAGRTFQPNKLAEISNSTMILALFDVLVQALKFWHTEDYCLLVYQTV